MKRIALALFAAAASAVLAAAPVVEFAQEKPRKLSRGAFLDPAEATAARSASCAWYHSTFSVRSSAPSKKTSSFSVKNRCRSFFALWKVRMP